MADPSLISDIALTCNWFKKEGHVDGTPYPGTCMQIKADTDPGSGSNRLTYEVYNKDADGNRGLILILQVDNKQGKMADEAYVTGTRCELVVPYPGWEGYVRVADAAGTGSASDFTVGEELMIDDGTGLCIRASGSEESAPFQVIEDTEDLTAAALVKVVYTGY